uniref:BPTI/Kunitz inhibitor domain-containing protein n=1 Tax=Steinernema glaseri TaxID=37863 RepID=A0A1I8ARG4_9BILA
MDGQPRSTIFLPPSPAMSVLFVALCLLACPLMSHAFEDACSLPKNPGYGNSSDTEPTQMFYFDNVWGSCYAFKYYGNGGNDNRFGSLEKCSQHCRLTDDYKICGPSKPRRVNYDCSRGLSCPDNYSCVKGTFFGFCCNTYSLWVRYRGTRQWCNDGSLAVASILEDGTRGELILGKTCDDLICGENAHCEQTNKYYAKCCMH